MQESTSLIITDHQEYCKDTINLYRHSMVHLAERLWHIHSKELWQGTYSTWEEFLQELGMKKSAASKLCTLYERMVIELQFPAETLYKASWTKLYTALPMMTDQESAKKAINKASLLTNSELLEERYEYKHGNECAHKNSSPFMYCSDCKRWIKVYEQDSSN